MGKKRRFNYFLSRWIKSDLPEEERSTVLLLGVTKIPTSPIATRRLLPGIITASATAVPSVEEKGVKQEQLHHNLKYYPKHLLSGLVRRKSSCTNRRSVIVRRNSSTKRAEDRRILQVPTVQISNASEILDVKKNDQLITLRYCSDSLECEKYHVNGHVDTALNTFKCVPTTEESVEQPTMDRSVDSIGTCSLDVEVSADFSDWTEASSTGTLRSFNTEKSSPEPHHLPSYLSLACTVNGYSTTTNYDPIRLARSRDASPHRIESDLTSTSKPIYKVKNNLLSPPNLVPLPKPKQVKMDNTTLAQQQRLLHDDFYSSTKTMTFLSNTESRFHNLYITKDATDSAIENGHHTIQSKCVSFETKNITTINGQTKCTSETIVKKQYSNDNETKSFIQQRVERLYGPGALAQGFFVSKRQMNRPTDSEIENAKETSNKHSKSMSDELLDNEPEPVMKQSTSSPTLPVLRHLRPEFRAQLLNSSLKKGVTEGAMQKSVTIPQLKDDDFALNGNSKMDQTNVKLSDLDNFNNERPIPASKADGEKNGHYFLKILDEQTRRLLALADQIESEISTPNLSEEVIGKLRSTAGKAKLLVSQKMQQFKGLCSNNINQIAGEAFPTTNEDLQGFWDMVMLQVNQVDTMFDEIDQLRKNNWKEIAIDQTKTVANGTARPKKVINRPVRPNSAANEEARKQREAQRKKMIEERRKAMKAQQQNPAKTENIEIFVPESS